MSSRPLVKTESDLRNELWDRVANVSQAKLSEELGISSQYFNDILHGRRSISFEVAQTMGYEKRIVYVKLN